GLAVRADGTLLFVAATWGDAVCLVPPDKPDQRELLSLEKDSYPYACAVDAPGHRLFVSLWNRAAVAVLDLRAKRVTGTWPTEPHPTELALSADGKRLFVACANSTKVSVLDTETGKGQETIACSLYPAAPVGNTPNGLSLAPDDQMLFVANADANNLAVFNVA